MSKPSSLTSIVTLFVVTIALLAGCAGNKKGEITHLREEFLDGCGNQSCWRGIRPGVTSGEKAIKNVNESEVTYEFNGDPQYDPIWLCNWKSNGKNAPYTWASMNVTNGTVSQISFDTRVTCPANFIDAFGDPDLVDGGDDGYGLWYNDELMLAVVYITETFPQLRTLYMFSAESYSEYSTNILSVQIPWEGVKDILTQGCSD